MSPALLGPRGVGTASRGGVLCREVETGVPARCQRADSASVGTGQTRPGQVALRPAGRAGRGCLGGQAWLQSRGQCPLILGSSPLPTWGTRAVAGISVVTVFSQQAPLCSPPVGHAHTKSFAKTRSLSRLPHPR